MRVDTASVARRGSRVTGASGSPRRMVSGAGGSVQPPTTSHKAAQQSPRVRRRFTELLPDPVPSRTIRTQWNKHKLRLQCLHPRRKIRNGGVTDEVQDSTAMCRDVLARPRAALPAQDAAQQTLGLLTEFLVELLFEFFFDQLAGLLLTRPQQELARIRHDVCKGDRRVRQTAL